jgi:hypothetical protein
VTERKQPVPKWEVLAENRTVWEQLRKQLRLEAGDLGWFGLVLAGRPRYSDSQARDYPGGDAGG